MFREGLTGEYFCIKPIGQVSIFRKIGVKFYDGLVLGCCFVDGFGYNMVGDGLMKVVNLVLIVQVIATTRMMQLSRPREEGSLRHY